MAKRKVKSITAPSELNKADQFSWRFLVDTGYVVNDNWDLQWDEYAGRFTKNDEATKECLEKIKTVGIDWTKTRPVGEGTGSKFVDTFGPSDTVPTIEGTLVLKDDTEYDWGTQNVTLTDISAYLIEFLGANLPDIF